MKKALLIYGKELNQYGVEFIDNLTDGEYKEVIQKCNRTFLNTNSPNGLIRYKSKTVHFEIEERNKERIIIAVNEVR